LRQPGCTIRFLVRLLLLGSTPPLLTHSPRLEMAGGFSHAKGRPCSSKARTIFPVAETNLSRSSLLWRREKIMPKHGSGKDEKSLGPRRLSAKIHSRRSVPATENTKESGPRRLYAPPGTPTSTSTKESGPRRLYTSAAVFGAVGIPVIKNDGPGSGHGSGSGSGSGGSGSGSGGGSGSGSGSRVKPNH
jgi:hypothetical protein